MAAEVGGGDGKRRPRIDMTPMVDLGFLLLTFFVLTTTMSNPKAMQIVVPADVEDQPEITPPPVPCGRVLTLMLTGENRVFWYMCKNGKADEFELNAIGYGDAAIRNLVRDRQASVLQDPSLRSFADRDLIVMLKVSEDASYKNLVDMLDEMSITRQSKYMLMDMTSEDIALVKDYEAAQGMSNSVQRSIELVGLPSE
jgi:biopolymer transport protein ExbD